MSLVILGLSHHNASLETLEGISLDAAKRAELGARVARSEHVAETVVVSTCNRTEVYVEAVTFHGAVGEVTDALARASGLGRTELTEQLAVHFEDRAIAHAFRVASGLDSMSVGESQIRAQLRHALREAQDAHIVGPGLNSLFQQALRVGKRVHTETGIEAVSASLVETGYRGATEHVGPLERAHVLVVGAGAMAALSAVTAQRMGAGRITVANRTLGRAQGLAERVGGFAIGLDDLARGLPEADIVVCCIGARGVVIDRALAAAARTARGERGPQVYLDLALPHDVDTDVATLLGVVRTGLDGIAAHQHSASSHPAVQAATELVTGEVADFLTARSQATAAPTIAALRSRASEVLEVELARLHAKTPDLTPAQRREVEIAMGRLIDKLLHTPTVRVRELAAQGQMGPYADALAELFALDPTTVAAVTAPPPFRLDHGAGGGR